jgi:3-oxoacid CoA-transferase B subunit
VNEVPVAKERLMRELVAMRVARELPQGAYVNLGIGLPMIVSEYTPAEKEVMFHVENGLLGVGRAQDGRTPSLPQLTNAGGQPVTMVPGAWLFDSAQSFALVRGGHIDVAVLGALQVSEKGDLANWRRADRVSGSIGGAADIATGVKQLFVAMEHTTDDGTLKILPQCTYPLTAVGVVKMIFTDVAVIAVREDGLHLREMAPGWTPEEVQSITGAHLHIDADVQEIDLSM